MDDDDKGIKNKLDTGKRTRSAMQRCEVNGMKERESEWKKRKVVIALDSLLTI